MQLTKDVEKVTSLIDLIDSLKRNRLLKTAFPALPLFSWCLSVNTFFVRKLLSIVLLFPQFLPMPVHLEVPPPALSSPASDYPSLPLSSWGLNLMSSPTTRFQSSLNSNKNTVEKNHNVPLWKREPRVCQHYSIKPIHVTSG